MLNIKTEPTTSEKVKEAALTAASVAAVKAQEMKEKAATEIAPVVAAKAEEAKSAAAPHVEAVVAAATPHVEHAREVAVAKRDEALEKAAEARDAAAERREDAMKEAKKRNKAVEKKSKKAAKKADKKVAFFAKQADKKSSRFAKKLDKKATTTFGVGQRQDGAYKAAALRGQAQAIAEDKGLTADNVRDLYKDELLPHIKELVAAATAAAATAQKQARDGAQQAVSYLPADAQTQVAKFAPAVAPKKKGGTMYIVTGLAALGGAGYLFWAQQQKQKQQAAQLSEMALADSQAHNTDELTINNPVTNFAHAEDTTVVNTAGEAGGPGTAATWEDTNHDGSVTSTDLEGGTPATRREARGDR